MDTNPYRPPLLPQDKVRKSRLRLALDVFTLIFAFAPCLLAVGYRVIDNAHIRNNLETVGLITWGLYLLWSISLALHIWGTAEGRRISMFGIFCNVVTVLVIICHILF